MSYYSRPGASSLDQDAFRHNSRHIVEWPLHPWWRGAVFLAAIIVVSVGVSWEGILAARSVYPLDGYAASEVANALRHDPDNPDLMHRLGFLYSLDPLGGNQDEAVQYLRRAVEHTPQRWDFWADLGNGCDYAGDTACSDAAFDRAVSLNPMTPALQWSVGNHFFFTNRPEKAFPCFRKLLNIAPEYLVSTFRLCLRATHDPQTIYNQVVAGGNSVSTRMAFLLFLASDADYENSIKVWKQMVSGPDHTPDAQTVKPFLDFLIDRSQIADAGIVWNDLQHAGMVPAPPEDAAHNLVYNGGFEKEPLNLGFDWRLDDSPFLVIDAADPSAHSGSRSLRIDFIVGRNAGYELVHQVIRVKPNTRYQLTGYVRSQSLTSFSGPRLSALEVGCGNCGARVSDPTLGTTPWHLINVEFTTQPQTEAVRVSFLRPAAHQVAGDITGTVWLDDVRLEALGSSDLAANMEKTR